VTWENRDRRGRKADPEWANRRRLLSARERLTPAADDPDVGPVHTGGPSGQLLAAYIAKEKLRDRSRWPNSTRTGRGSATPGAGSALGARCSPTSRRSAGSPKPSTPWWPEVEALLRLNITNARTEGSNLAIKTIKRAGRGFSNKSNHQRRILANATAKKVTSQWKDRLTRNRAEPSWQAWTQAHTLVGRDAFGEAGMSNLRFRAGPVPIALKLARSVRAATLEHCTDCAHENQQIAHHRPVLDVVHIEAYPFLWRCVRTS
jgi:Transposase